MKKIIRKLLSSLYTLIIIFLVILSIFITILSFNAKKNNNIPSIFGYTVFSVQTDSMEGTINPGDLIIGKIVDPSELKVNDIISFNTITSQGQIFVNTHRIVKIENIDNTTLYTTKGDNLDFYDESKVLPGDVISRYTNYRIPFIGKIITFLNNKFGFFIFIVIPVFIYTLLQVYKLIMLIFENQKEKILEEAVNNTSEDLKKKIIEEYLSKNKNNENT